MLLKTSFSQQQSLPFVCTSAWKLLLSQDAGLSALPLALQDTPFRLHSAKTQSEQWEPSIPTFAHPTFGRISRWYTFSSSDLSSPSVRSLRQEADGSIYCAREYYIPFFIIVFLFSVILFLVQLKTWAKQTLEATWWGPHRGCLGERISNTSHQRTS